MRMTFLGTAMLVAAAGTAGAEAHLPSEIMVDQARISGAEACPARMPSGRPELLCSCTPGAAEGSVWGTNPYTGDSDVCTAARHAGAIDVDGGPVMVLAQDGQDSYDGSEANGVTTRSWGSYGNSIAIVRVAAKADVEACGVLPGGLDEQTCSCPTDDGTRGAIYGAGPYTADSDICTAARHAGVVGREGGVVTVLRIQGLDAYGDAEANGITPRGWSSYTSSIVFDRN